MKLREVIERVRQTEDNSAAPRLDEFCAALDVEEFSSFDAEFDLRVKGYYLKKWLCTDTFVGTVVWFFDGVPAAVSHRPARKSDTQYALVSEEKARELRKFILALRDRDRLEPDILDLEGEIPSTYKVAYVSQLLADRGLVDGEPCKVVKKLRGLLSKDIVVEFEDGRQAEVGLEGFEIPLEVV